MLTAKQLRTALRGPLCVATLFAGSVFVVGCADHDRDYEDHHDTPAYRDGAYRNDGYRQGNYDRDMDRGEYRGENNRY